MENQQINQPLNNNAGVKPASESKQIETQISVIDIINMILTFWWLIVILAVLVGGGTYAYSKLTSVERYSSGATLYINTQTEQKTDDVNINAISGARDLMPTYIEILSSKPFLETISDDVDNKYDYSEIYSMITYSSEVDTNILAISVTLNKVMLLGTSKTEVKIVSPRSREIREEILSRVDRGVTILHGEGGYLHQDTEVILSIVSNHELPRIERLARDIDPDCFMIISRVTEVWGRGFTGSKMHQQKNG